MQIKDLEALMTTLRKVLLTAPAVALISIVMSSTNVAAQQEGGGAFQKTRPSLAVKRPKKTKSQSAVLSGSWKSDYGVIRFRTSGASVSANYPFGGKLSGRIRGNRLSGYWNKPAAYQKCGKARFGTRYWGRFSFSFDAALSRFRGRFGYCDGPLQKSWAGTRAGR